MDDLRVPKRKVLVEIVLVGGSTRRTWLFLAEAAPDHDGPELPHDLVNGPGPFVPGVDDGSGEVAFLNLGAVAVVRLPRELDAGEDAFDLPTEHRVALTLLDGSRLQGIISYVRPGGARLVEVLNEPPPFVRLIEAGGVALVNKRQVARVDLLSR
jgi:hypothetical protein